jgi:tight adherence protein B
VARLAASGASLTPAFRDVAGPAADAWRRVGAVLGLAASIGAPAASALQRAAAGLRSGAELHRTVRTSVSGPAASARTTMVLPPASALIGWAFGFDVPGTLVGNPIAGGAAVLALVLLGGAAMWSRRLIRGASRVPWRLGLGVELVALAVRGGLPTSVARDRARETAAEAGLPVEAEDEAALDGVVAFADRAGVPLAPLLDGEADRIRRSALAEASASAVVLAVRLLVPLGALVLPAFLLLGALPIGLAVLSSTTLPL